MSNHPIRTHFSAAADTYDQGDSVQRDIGALLLRRADTGAAPHAILDVGCGGGFHAGALHRRYPGARLVCVDAAFGMAARTAEKVPGALCLVCCGEAPALAQPFDLIFCNMTAQWFSDIPAGLARLAQNLAPDGLLLASLPLADSFSEWRETLAALGYPCGLYPLPTAEDMRTLAVDGCHIKTTVTRRSYFFADARAFILHFRKIGAQTAQRGYAPLSPAQTFSALARLNKKALRDGVKITYNIATIEIRKTT